MQRTFLAILLLVVFVSPAQNLVMNPGFEENNHPGVTNGYGRYPNATAYTLGRKTDSLVVPGWNINWHSHPSYSLSRTLYGYQNYGSAHSGSHKSGLMVYYNSQWPHHYLQGTLTAPLKAGTTYCISMYVRFGSSEYRLETLQVLFSTEQTPIPVHLDLIPEQPQVEIDSLESTTLFFTYGYVSGYYRAQGGERFFTIGNFMDDNCTDTVPFGDRGIYPLDWYTESAAYSFDDVCVTPYNGPALPTVPRACSERRVGKIHFPLGESKIQEESSPLLDEVIRYLKKEPGVNVILSGHTDSTGTESNNQLLSEQRAKNVADFLIANGIDSSRVTCKGFASSQPIIRRIRVPAKEIVKRYNPEQSRRVEIIFSFRTE